MVDGTTTDAVDPADIWPDFIARLPKNLPITVVRNKADITSETLGISEVNGHSLVRLSARTGEGVDVLRNHLKQSMGFDTNMEDGFLARRRHLQALAEAAEHLAQGKAQLLGAWAGGIAGGRVASGAAKLKRDYRGVYLRRFAGTNFLQFLYR
ncbi:tRNA modification GTPase TrmE [Salmonella enterica subsp. indica]|uniref:tRNA modification GTPase TrmE n=1 Tax=Salmonella enterica subsp. indica TaxID=59207 RepID=A0A379XWX2_SALER|nr:tRNA modification GTPase TrmE [Salmonella enterica subsp. indica]